jgi:hypothetical protein
MTILMPTMCEGPTRLVTVTLTAGIAHAVLAPVRLLAVGATATI